MSFFTLDLCCFYCIWHCSGILTNRPCWDIIRSCVAIFPWVSSFWVSFATWWGSFESFCICPGWIAKISWSTEASLSHGEIFSISHIMVNCWSSIIICSLIFSNCLCCCCAFWMGCIPSVSSHVAIHAGCSYITILFISWCKREFRLIFSSTLESPVLYLFTIFQLLPNSSCRWGVHWCNFLLVIIELFFDLFFIFFSFGFISRNITSLRESNKSSKRNKFEHLRFWLDFI